MVMLSPVRRSDAVVEYVCRVIDNDYKEVLDVDSIVGTDTRFITNHMPELHETGSILVGPTIMRVIVENSFNKININFPLK